MIEKQMAQGTAPALISSRNAERRRRLHKAHAKQAAKIAELQKALLALGYKTLSEQADLLGLKRSSVWAMFKSSHTRGGMAADTVKRMLAAVPRVVKQVIDEYVREKLAGAYGHPPSALKRFRSRAGLSAGAN
jgi:oligoendopeptidase F